MFTKLIIQNKVCLKTFLSKFALTFLCQLKNYGRTRSESEQLHGTISRMNDDY